MTATLAQIQKWREAHPSLEVDEAALMTAGPWPSLHVSDFVVYLEARGDDPDGVSFIRDFGREIAWAYGGWKKAARDSNASALLADMLNNASTVGDDAGQYAFVRRFLTHYAQANGIPLPGPTIIPIWLAPIDEDEAA